LIPIRILHCNYNNLLSEGKYTTVEDIEEEMSTEGNSSHWGCVDIIERSWIHGKRDRQTAAHNCSLTGLSVGLSPVIEKSV
jgi:hypothetical protein